jgi:hypothetical protein
VLADCQRRLGSLPGRTRGRHRPCHRAAVDRRGHRYPGRRRSPTPGLAHSP